MMPRAHDIIQIAVASISAFHDASDFPPGEVAVESPSLGCTHRPAVPSRDPIPSECFVETLRMALPQQPDNVAIAPSASTIVFGMDDGVRVWRRCGSGGGEYVELQQLEGKDCSLSVLDEDALVCVELRTSVFRV